MPTFTDLYIELWRLSMAVVNVLTDDPPSTLTDFTSEDDYGSWTCVE